VYFHVSTEAVKCCRKPVLYSRRFLETVTVYFRCILSSHILIYLPSLSSFITHHRLLFCGHLSNYDRSSQLEVAPVNGRQIEQATFKRLLTAESQRINYLRNKPAHNAEQGGNQKCKTAGHGCHCSRARELKRF
jgi:hypothetical protein